MMLYLVQHGEAVPKEVDPDRPLSESGRESVRRLGEQLGRHGHRPARVLHSGKLRAAETAGILASALGPGLEGAEMVGRLVANAEEQAILAFVPGSIACLERTEDGGWVIDWFLRPDIAA